MTNEKPQRVTVFINPQIAKQARVQAVVEEITVTALVEKALTKYLPKEIVVKKAETKLNP